MSYSHQFPISSSSFSLFFQSIFMLDSSINNKRRLRDGLESAIFDDKKNMIMFLQNVKSISIVFVEEFLYYQTPSRNDREKNWNFPGNSLALAIFPTYDTNHRDEKYDLKISSGNRERKVILIFDL